MRLESPLATTASVFTLPAKAFQPSGEPISQCQLQDSDLLQPFRPRRGRSSFPFVQAAPRASAGYTVAGAMTSCLMLEWSMSRLRSLKSELDRLFDCLRYGKIKNAAGTRSL
jgi:hypothetical protein